MCFALIGVRLIGSIYQDSASLLLCIDDPSVGKLLKGEHIKLHNPKKFSELPVLSSGCDGKVVKFQATNSKNSLNFGVRPLWCLVPLLVDLNLKCGAMPILLIVLAKVVLVILVCYTFVCNHISQKKLNFAFKDIFE
jgi:hypothetical protein